MTLARCWWAPIAVVDAFLIVVTAGNRYLPDIHSTLLGEGGWRILEPFNLARENNLASWWSFACLLAGGLLALECCCRRAAGVRWAWGVFACAFLGLSFDEVSSVHERTGGGRDWLPYLVPGALLVTAACIDLWRRPESRRTAVGLAVGLAGFGSVVLLELIERRLPWPSWSLGLRAGVEEGAEVVAELIVIAALVRMRGRTEGWRQALPRLPAVAWSGLVMGGLLLHCWVAWAWTPELLLSAKGNPGSWFPAVVYFSMFTGAALFQGGGCRMALLAAAAFLASADCVAILVRYPALALPDLAARLPQRWFGACHLGVALQVAALGALCVFLSGRSRLAMVAVAAGLAGWGLHSVSGAVHLLVPGLVAFVLALAAPPSLHGDGGAHHSSPSA